MSFLPRIKRESYAIDKTTREVGTKIGWPAAYVEVTRIYHTYRGKTEVTNTEAQVALSLPRGIFLGWTFATQSYPDRDEEGWPQ